MTVGKRTLSLGAAINKYSDPRLNPRYWPNTPQPFAHATDTFRNTTEQLKAYQACKDTIKDYLNVLRLMDKKLLAFANVNSISIRIFF